MLNISSYFDVMKENILIFFLILIKPIIPDRFLEIPEEKLPTGYKIRLLVLMSHIHFERMLRFVKETKISFHVS